MSSCLELEDTIIRTAFARSLSETFVVTSTPKKRKREDKNLDVASIHRRNNSKFECTEINNSDVLVHMKVIE